MTIVSIKLAASGENRRIELSDGSLFSFKPCYLPPIFVDESLYTPGISENREITAEEANGFRFASACMRAEKSALALITRAEQTFAGIARKLKKRGHEPACVYRVIQQLNNMELLDDCRYAQLWLDSRLNRRADSPRCLLAALRARGIERGDAEFALKNALDNESEFKLICRYVRKIKKRKLPRKKGGADTARSLKFILRGEGFSAQIIERFFDDETNAEL